MPIKLLLINDVDDLGRSGDVVTVKPGYARNFLLPGKFAVPADKQTLRMQAKLQEERRKKAIEDRKDAEKLATKFEGLTVSTVVKVDHEGHMYGSVTALDICHLLKEQASIDVEKRSVQLKHPIKEVGDYTIAIKLKEGVLTQVQLKVIPEEVQGSAPVSAAAPSKE